ncbi:hypothetical protein PHJA_001480500 [Phtheirospermum japonicum]|uniref:Uncharacterized protein n=1 Tax=Phtheirospermum japonicum TaxID=374723 RepID=A0A830CGC6_9LAMI|nr:hypothetical protein PHJA_001480500 [Phtheirospermum japonicum]
MKVGFEISKELSTSIWVEISHSNLKEERNPTKSTIVGRENQNYKNPNCGGGGDFHHANQSAAATPPLSAAAAW